MAKMAVFRAGVFASINPMFIIFKHLVCSKPDLTAGLFKFA